MSKSKQTLTIQNQFTNFVENCNKPYRSHFLLFILPTTVEVGVHTDHETCISLVEVWRKKRQGSVLPLVARQVYGSNGPK